MTQLREEWGESEFARRVWPDGGSEQRQKTTNDGEKVQTSERAIERAGWTAAGSSLRRVTTGLAPSDSQFVSSSQTRLLSHKQNIDYCKLVFHLYLAHFTCLRLVSRKCVREYHRQTRDDCVYCGCCG